jgi:hypothetical protein
MVVVEAVVAVLVAMAVVVERLETLTPTVAAVLVLL